MSYLQFIVVFLFGALVGLNYHAYYVESQLREIALRNPEIDLFEPTIQKFEKGMEEIRRNLENLPPQKVEILPNDGRGRNRGTMNPYHCYTCDK